MKAAILLCATTAFALDAAASNALFEQWVRQSNKKYATQAELELRRANFMANLEEVNRQNALHGKPSEATFRMNKFADLSKAERKSRYGFRVPSASLVESMGPRVFSRSGVVAPKAIDFRTMGVVAPIQDQAMCGSCWAFSAISNVESRIAILKKTNASKYSEQQLVDCDQVCGQYRDFNGCDSGCDGGLQPNAFTYLRDNEMKTEEEYPYTGMDGSCDANGRANGLITGFEMLAQNEEEIKNIVADKGPVAIAVDASEWSFYSGGIMTNTCSGTTFFDLNHAVNIVGYDTSKDGVDYWIIRNSWGEDWGENGYLRVARNKNQCGVNFFACSVTLKSM